MPIRGPLIGNLEVKSGRPPLTILACLIAGAGQLSLVVVRLLTGAARPRPGAAWPRLAVRWLLPGVVLLAGLVACRGLGALPQERLSSREPAARQSPAPPDFPVVEPVQVDVPGLAQPTSTPVDLSQLASTAQLLPATATVPSPETEPFVGPAASSLAPTDEMGSPLLPAATNPPPSELWPADPRRLTSGGCCTQPFWSPDGQQVLYIDKPAPDAPAGVWGVDLQGNQPRLIIDQVGLFSPDLTLAAYLEEGQTVVARLADGARWFIPNEGRAVIFSSGGDQVAWQAGSVGPPIDTAWRETWVSQVDGGGARQVWGAYGGVLAGWTPGGQVLVSGRLRLDDDQQTIWMVDPADGRARELGRGFLLRGGLLSPGGSWLAYQVLFSANTEENGLWLSHLETGERRRLGMFGSYRWRDDGRLLVFVPGPQRQEPRLWEVEAASGRARLLPGMDGTGLRIAAGDWSVSPDGDWIAFVSAEDGNIWLIAVE